MDRWLRVAVPVLVAMAYVTAAPGTARADRQDVGCGDIPGNTSLGFEVALVRQSGKVWSYGMTVTEYAAPGCTGPGRVLSADAANRTIDNVMVGSCELGARVARTSPIAVWTDTDETGLTGWKFEAVDFSRITLEMDAPYAGGGSTGFLIYPEANRRLRVEVSVDGPDCALSVSSTPTPTPNPAPTPTVAPAAAGSDSDASRYAVVALATAVVALAIVASVLGLALVGVVRRTR